MYPFHPKTYKLLARAHLVFPRLALSPQNLIDVGARGRVSNKARGCMRLLRRLELVIEVVIMAVHVWRLRWRFGVGRLEMR